jgi:hypothetical protein
MSAAIGQRARTQTRVSMLDVIGAARGIRTPDPIITNDVLYRLSYCGYARGDSPRGQALQATGGH